MLNSSAKEFVPAAASRQTVAAAPSSKDSGDCNPQCSLNSQSDGKKWGSDAACGSSGGNKLQLSPKAPEFVPRGCSAAVTGCCILDTASDPPRSVLTPPRSDSTLSSSVMSREADGWGYGEKQWYGDEHPEQCGVTGYGGEDPNSCNGDVFGYYYNEGQVKLVDEYVYGVCGSGGVATGVNHGGELVPDDAAAFGYDAFGCCLYDRYGHLHNSAVTDTCAYYDGQYPYDSMASLPFDSSVYSGDTYYWDESSGTFPYQYASQYGEWQQPSHHHEVYPYLPLNNTAEDGNSHLYSNTNGAHDPDAYGELHLEDEALRSLAPSAAAELLEMFFPHYAGEALSRVLERTGGDTLAAFQEVAAMERQVAVERATAAAAGGRGAHVRRGGGRSSREPWLADRSGGRRLGSGAGGGGEDGASAFKLDLEAFPALPRSPALAPTGPNTTVLTIQLSGAAANGSADPTRPVADWASRDAQPLTTEVLPNTSTPATTANPTSLKPDFAALLRGSSPSSAASASIPAPTRGPVAAATMGAYSCSALGAGLSARPAARGASSAAAAASTAATPLASAVPWVSTGDAVSSQYSEERREASLLARVRNQCFQQATMAYLSGNKALAKELGRRGRELNEAMKAAHAVAARRIFAQRNGLNPTASAHPPRRQQPRQRRPHALGEGRRIYSVDETPTAMGLQQHELHQPARMVGEALFVDLHGLHAVEAVSVLELQIAEARAAGCRFLRVCTGTGHHTKGAKTPARLPTAVAEALLSNHLTFRTLKPGLLEAQL